MLEGGESEIVRFQNSSNLQNNKENYKSKLQNHSLKILSLNT